MGLVEYRVKTRDEPNFDWDGFFEFVRGLVHVKFSKEQLFSKIRKLRRRFLVNMGRINQGQDPFFTRSTDSQAFGYSNMIWGQDDAADDVANGTNMEEDEVANGRSMEGAEIGNGRSMEEDEVARNMKKAEIAKGRNMEEDEIGNGGSMDKDEVANGRGRSMDEAEIANGRSMEKDEVANMEEGEVANERNMEKAEIGNGRSMERDEVANMEEDEVANGRNMEKAEIANGRSMDEAEIANGRRMEKRVQIENGEDERVANEEHVNGNGAKKKRKFGDKTTEYMTDGKESHEEDEDDDDFCVVEEAFETMVLRGSSGYQKKLQLEKLRNLGTGKIKELSNEWKSLCAEELKLNIKKFRFSLELVEAANDGAV